MIINQLKIKSGPSYEYTNFASSPIPTSWTTITTGTVYSSTNDYGKWTIQASSYNGTASNALFYAFDGATSDNHYIPSGTGGAWFLIFSPVAIKPSKIYLNHQNASGTIQGLNVETDEWETLANVSNGTIAINTDNYFSQFKINYNAAANTFTIRRTYEFQITEGTIKITKN